ncbi:MAG: helix-turn-helix domain-containing protein [Pseudonocardiaceae bacterium]
MDTEDNITMGQRLRRIRKARGKSLRVLADLTGGVVSFGTLSDIENGKAPLDSLRVVTALAQALEIAPSELTRLPIPAPANGETDAAVDAVRGALMAVNHRRSGGLVLPVTTVRERVNALVAAGCLGEQERVGRDLPGLIADLHTSMAAGRDVAELLELAVLLHTQATIAWLRFAGAPVDLREQAATLARQAAEQRDTPAALGLAAAGAVRVMLSSGAFALAQAELDSVTVPTTTPESTQLAGMLALYESEVAAADARPADVDAALQHAVELAERTGEGNAYWIGFGPTNTGICRVSVALEVGDHDRAVSIAQSLNPAAHANPSRRAAHWVYYGRAAARLRDHRGAAVRAFLTAEEILPHRVRRDPFARQAIAGLVARSPQGRVGEELRGLAWRADLPV